MRSLNEVLDTVLELQATPLGSEKTSFLGRHKDDLQLRQFLYYLLNNQVVLGLKKLPPVGKTKDLTVEFQDFINLVKHLSTSNMNNALRDDVLEFISALPSKYHKVLSEYFTKKLKLGVTAKSINKVVPHMIPVFSCMLADVVDEIPVEWFPVSVELKFDGVRCLAVVNEGTCKLFTRQGNIIPLPNIENEFLKLAKGENVTFDCELISDERTDVSGKINSLIKTGYTPIKALGITARVFDIVNTKDFISQTVTAQPLVDRQHKLYIHFIKYKGELLRQSVAIQASTADEVKHLTNKYILDGEEGTVVKPLTGRYEYKRSKSWIKYKAINSVTLKVTGFTQGEGSREGLAGALICESQDGKIKVDVGSGLTHEDLANIAKHPETYIGAYVEVEYNVMIDSESKDGYSLFLPRFKDGWLRIDKTQADTFNKALKEHIGKPQISLPSYE